MANVELQINGTAYTGWHEIEVVRSIDSLAGRFRLRLTTMDPHPVPRGAKCDLLLNGNKVISGFVFNVAIDIAGSTHTLMVNGRDRTADLVDADTLIDAQEVYGLTLREIVERVCAPFKIPVSFEVPAGRAFKKFSFQQETAFEAIERACRMRGLLPSSDAEGNLVIRNYGTERAPAGLFIGENVLEASANYDDSDRFSIYYVYGQQPGTDEVDEEAAVGPQGSARDAGVTRYRPKIILAEVAVDAGLAQARAEWEAAVRAAKATTFSCTVNDWDVDGAPWRENQMVRAYLPQLGVDGDMLIKEVTYGLSNDSGTTTKLELVRPDAFKMQPDLEAEELAKGKNGEDEEF